MQVQNKGMKDAELNVGGKIVRSDEVGVFDVDEEMGKRLLTLPGFRVPAMTVELQAAYAEYKKASDALVAAQAASDSAKLRVANAQAQADRGQGTQLGNGAASTASLTPAAPRTAVTPAPAPEKAPEKASEAAAGASEIRDAAAKLKAKLGNPTMRWKLDDLLTYAQSLGMGADSSWQKSDILTAIEEIESE